MKLPSWLDKGSAPDVYARMFVDNGIDVPPELIHVYKSGCSERICAECYEMAVSRGILYNGRCPVCESPLTGKVNDMHIISCKSCHSYIRYCSAYSMGMFATIVWAVDLDVMKVFQGVEYDII